GGQAVAGVGAVPAHGGVGPAVPEEGVVLVRRGVAGDEVDRVAAVHGVVARAAVHDVDVGSGVAVTRVVHTRRGVGDVGGEDLVITGAAGEPVTTGSADDGGTGRAEELRIGLTRQVGLRVVGGHADRVRATATVEGVVAEAGRDHVVAVAVRRAGRALLDRGRVDAGHLDRCGGSAGRQAQRDVGPVGAEGETGV